jgi:type IV pilus assembly protein PilM
MNSHWVIGLDLGSHSVKAAAVCHAGRRSLLGGLATFRQDRTASEGDPPPGLSKAAAKQASKWLSDLGLTGCAAAVAVPTSHSALKWITLPALPPDDFQHAARAKVRKELPFPADEAYIAATGKTAEGGECMVAAVEKSILTGCAQSALSLGAAPFHAETEAQSVQRLIRRETLSRGRQNAASSVTLVDIGFHATRMFVIHDGHLKFARSIKFGAAGFVNRISQTLGVPASEATALLESSEAWLTSAGTIHVPLGGQAAVVGVDQELVILTREIHRLVRYFRSIFPARSFSGIYDRFSLCGGLSGLRGLTEFIGNEVQMKVEAFDPLARLDVDLPFAAFEGARRSGGIYATAIGLALANPTAHTLEEDHAFSWARS